MMHRKLVAAAAIGASVIGGAAGGALLFAPDLSGAQEASTSVAAAEAPAAAPAGRPGPGLRGDTLATAAKALGMTEADLRTALEGGKTIAEVAKDKGVDVQKVIDALVAEATTDLKDRITDMVNGKLPAGGMHGPEGREGFGGRMGPAFEAGLDTVASALGMTEADLRTALQSGKTIADIAKDKGVAVDTLVTKLVDAAGKKIDQAVTDGKLTQDQATKLKSALKERITALVNGSRPAGGGRHGFGRGGMGGPPQAEGSSSTSGSGATTY